MQLSSGASERGAKGPEYRSDVLEHRSEYLETAGNLSHFLLGLYTSSEEAVGEVDELHHPLQDRCQRTRTPTVFEWHETRTGQVSLPSITVTFPWCHRARKHSCGRTLNPASSSQLPIHRLDGCPRVSRQSRDCGFQIMRFSGRGVVCPLISLMHAR